MSTKRILADIGELNKPIYAESGIFYKEDEANVRNGYACIFGPKDTPYEDCPMLYAFTISEGFPFDPPKVLFKTSDAITRFHPNMYVDGKVCLSILHTWEGPKWASTMRLSTILLTLQSLMDADPIQHEPGYPNPTETTKKSYACFVEYACIQYILERAERPLQPDAFLPFEIIFKERLPKILERLEVRLNKLLQGGEKTLNNVPYSLYGTTNYKKCLERATALKLKA
jgi:ubiquitin-conjugating enzyme E2 Z